MQMLTLPAGQRTAELRVHSSSCTALCATSRKPSLSLVAAQEETLTLPAGQQEDGSQRGCRTAGFTAHAVQQLRRMVCDILSHVKLGLVAVLQGCAGADSHLAGWPARGQMPEWPESCRPHCPCGPAAALHHAPPLRASLASARSAAASPHAPAVCWVLGRLPAAAAPALAI